MIALALTALLGAAPAQGTSPFKIPPIRLEVPSDWTHTEKEGTHRFAAPSGEAWLEVDVGQVQTRGMSAETCVQKITAAVGGRFERLQLGGQPAAHAAVVDVDKKRRQFASDTWVGCNGRTTWSLSAHHVKAKAAEHLPVLERVAASLEYLEGKGK